MANNFTQQSKCKKDISAVTCCDINLKRFWWKQLVYTQFFSPSGSLCVQWLQSFSKPSIKQFNKAKSLLIWWSMVVCSTRGHSTRFYWWVFDGKTLDGGGRTQVDGKGGLIRKLRGWIGPSVQSPIDLSGRKCHTVAHYRSTQLNCMRNKWLPLLLNCPRIPENQKISLIWKIQLGGTFYAWF